MIEEKIIQLKTDSIWQDILQRLGEFEVKGREGNKSWFSELCFCLLTANSRADTAIAIQAELGAEGFCSLSQDDICQCIIKHKHRFHNNKSKYIIQARRHVDIKSKVMAVAKVSGEVTAREFLVKNIKGLGYKEASHFLRNVGFKNLAILDRHILRTLSEEGLIDMPKSITKKRYLEIESIFNGIAEKLAISPAHLDLAMWYLKTGRVLK